ncbi:MAG: STAS domain-containing protein [Coxiellaceae bacterium]|nr:STAS domain-containing protein [Coxiellaceae bacterium]
MTMVISLNQAVSYDTVMDVRQEVAKQIKVAKAPFDIDFAELSDYDSSMLTLMLCWLRLARQQGVTCRFVNVSDELINMARVYGLDKLLPLVERGLNG